MAKKKTKRTILSSVTRHQIAESLSMSDRQLDDRIKYGWTDFPQPILQRYENKEKKYNEKEVNEYIEKKTKVNLRQENYRGSQRNNFTYEGLALDIIMFLKPNLAYKEMKIGK